MSVALTPDDVEAGRGNDRIGTQLVLEGDGMRVWHLRLAAGETLPPHRHDRPYFWTVLSAGQGRSCYGDGRVVDVVYQPGDTSHFADLSANNGFVHDLTNTGDTELVFVTVEFAGEVK